MKGNQLLLEIHSFLTSRGVNPTHLCGDYLINHDIRIPMKQPGFQCKVKPGVFFCGSLVESQVSQSRTLAKDDGDGFFVSLWCFTGCRIILGGFYSFFFPKFRKSWET